MAVTKPLNQPALAEEMPPVRAGEDAIRHELSWSVGEIRGKIHAPRGIPVILARPHVTTPENLLVSEAFRLCIGSAAVWKLRGGAEAQYAAKLMGELQAYESTFLSPPPANNPSRGSRRAVHP